MKTFSFFSAKGGTGKTTFNMLFASYLSYVKGQRVFFLDFDAPEYNCFFTRDRELKAGAAFDGLFEICCVEDQSRQNIANISSMLKNLEGKVDYVIMDFPGSFNKRPLPSSVRIQSYSSTGCSGSTSRKYIQH